MCGKEWGNRHPPALLMDCKLPAVFLENTWETIQPAVLVVVTATQQQQELTQVGLSIYAYLRIKYYYHVSFIDEAKKDKQQFIEEWNRLQELEFWVQMIQWCNYIGIIQFQSYPAIHTWTNTLQKTTWKLLTKCHYSSFRTL